MKNLSFATQENAFSKKTSEELNIIIKSDVHGSAEAIKFAVSNIKHDEVKTKILHSDIGMVTESDVTLAKASDAIVIAFNVKPSKEAKKLAEQENIRIENFNIIYELIDYIKNKMSGLLTPEVNEEITGTAEVLDIFKVSKVGKVAGSKILDGEINQDSQARIIRDGTVVHSGKIGSIFREKNQVKQVNAGLECGISLKDFNDFQIKDIIEAYRSKTIERQISS
jgi:Translation initiation factor 2 (IF-2; GTPase)